MHVYSCFLSTNIIIIIFSFFSVDNDTHFIRTKILFFATFCIHRQTMVMVVVTLKPHSVASSMAVITVANKHNLCHSALMESYKFARVQTHALKVYFVSEKNIPFLCSHQRGFFKIIFLAVCCAMFFGLSEDCSFVCHSAVVVVVFVVERTFLAYNSFFSSFFLCKQKYMTYFLPFYYYSLFHNLGPNFEYNK